MRLAGFLQLQAGKKMVYIAGKVTGLEYNTVWFKFKNRQIQLEALGYAVLNPCEWVQENADWQAAMKECVVLLAGAADAIDLLPDWEASEGATLEMQLCERFGIPRLNPCDCELKDGKRWDYNCQFGREVHNDNIVCTKS